MKDDDESTEPPVAVVKRMQGFELVVAQGNGDHRINSMISLQPRLPFLETGQQLVSRWRWYESSFLDSTRSMSNNDLNFSNAACIRGFTGSSFDENRLELA
jgi:hypothetical protein